MADEIKADAEVKEEKLEKEPDQSTLEENSESVAQPPKNEETELNDVSKENTGADENATTESKTETAPADDAAKETPVGDGNELAEEGVNDEPSDQPHESGSVKGDNISEKALSVSTIPMAPAMISDSQVMEEDEMTYAALRGKANTPASVYTELTDGRDLRALSRPSAGVRTQEAFYQKAVDLISARCTSSVKMVSTEPLMGVRDPPPGFGAPRVFFIHQRRPRPMTPLKVWRGYHGNVYFEPMKINQASMKEQALEVHLPPMNRCSEKLQTVISQTRWNPEHVIRYRQNRSMYTPILQELPPSERFKNSRRPVLVLDKETIQRNPDEIEELHQIESTGTLRIQTATESQLNMETPGLTMGSSIRSRSPTRNEKSKVCKGSVARKLVMFRNLMIPLMQDQLGKASSPLRSPAESNPEFHSRESPSKLPSINAKPTRTPLTPGLRIK